MGVCAGDDAWGRGKIHRLPRRARFMPHMTHSCRCGKTIHWPRTAKIGDRWRCRRCGAVSILAEQGQPGRIQSSRSTAAQNNSDFLPGGSKGKSSPVSAPSSVSRPGYARTSPATSRTSSVNSRNSSPTPSGGSTGCAVWFIVATICTTALYALNRFL